MSNRLRTKIASAVARQVAQAGPIKGRVYFFNTIVADSAGLRESRSRVHALVILALEEYDGMKEVQ